MRLLLTLAAIAIALYALHRLAVWMESRGWIYYQKKRGSSGSLGSALLRVDEILQPGRRHVIEAREMEERDGDESADPPPQ